ncbi:MAG: GH36 C-terminal domain-containing protein [Planctomycetota bacterium]|nr:GH36 C-terminal domain-containing protein [Planctomycetota bacterium]
MGYHSSHRRAQSREAGQVFRLRGLDDAATYEVKDMDTGKVTEYTGAELMSGLPVELPTPQQAALISYRRAAK